MASYYKEDTKIWLDGRLVKASEAQIDLYSQSMHYGYAVFEGIRSYRTVSGETRVFKEKEHYERLEHSARSLNLPYTFSVEEMIAATYAVLEANNLQDAYIRPLVYAPANMTFSVNKESYVTIQAWLMAPFLGDRLLRVMTSSFQRPNPKGFIISAKASGHYVNSILASQEAKSKGFDEALLTDMHGLVAEGPGANMFYEKEGVLYTPQPGNILPGITRQTILELCAELGIEVVEKQITISEVKGADAAFFCGTAAEVIGWESFDNVPFAKSWNETLSRKLQQAYSARVTEAAQVAEEIR
jgi:branched-chain amino acid aminotransferase